MRSASRSAGLELRRWDAVPPGGYRWPHQSLVEVLGDG